MNKTDLQYRILKFIGEQSKLEATYETLRHHIQQPLGIKEDDFWYVLKDLYHKSIVRVTNTHTSKWYYLETGDDQADMVNEKIKIVIKTLRTQPSTGRELARACRVKDNNLSLLVALIVLRYQSIIQEENGVWSVTK